MTPLAAFLEVWGPRVPREYRITFRLALLRLLLGERARIRRRLTTDRKHYERAAAVTAHEIVDEGGAVTPHGGR
jgi:hypothetical protein